MRKCDSKLIDLNSDPIKFKDMPGRTLTFRFTEKNEKLKR